MPALFFINIHLFSCGGPLVCSVMTSASARHVFMIESATSWWAQLHQPFKVMMRAHCLSFQKPTIFAEWILISWKLIWTNCNLMLINNSIFRSEGKHVLMWVMTGMKLTWLLYIYFSRQSVYRVAHPHITFDSSTARLKRWLIWAPFCDLETFIGSQPKLYSFLSLFYSEHKKRYTWEMRVVLSNQNCQLSGFMFIYAGRLKDQKDFPRDPFFFFSLYLCCV